MNESDARIYIKSLILRNKPLLLEKAMEHYKVKFGHSFWGKQDGTDKATPEIASRLFEG